MAAASDRYSPVARAIADLHGGKAIVLLAHDGFGDLVFAAQHATPQLVSFMVRHTSGYVAVALTEHACDRLDLPPMHPSHTDPSGNGFTVSVDAKDGVRTGISATDRAHTIRLLGNNTTHSADLVRPGHVLPSRVSAGGVLTNPGRGEAAVDLVRLAGLQPAGALCELVSQREIGEMATEDEVREFAQHHSLALVTVAEVIAYRRRFEKQVQKAAVTRLPTAHGEFMAYGYENVLDGLECIALVRGEVRGCDDVPVRLHAECLAGDVFGSMRCDCRSQLEASLADIGAAGRGIVLYVRNRDVGDVGPRNKLQLCGTSEIDAESAAGARYCSTGAQVLDELGVRSVALLANSADIGAALEASGLRVGNYLGSPTESAEPNVHYLPAVDTSGASLDLSEGRCDRWVCSA
ncbi:3,4-dihydroxy-2-butanone-4-phosphate synthase [Mycobacterium vicinigordonae]|uniref:3,4-dihydroxy-2-butanone-4-phosphate synthase n=1 Tax=Mycobacterium vicinigordonae TaxID=1719132 RepID=A0A7D6IS15_9MYCO|nr:3,4-dihydroxy-2-butanone-4-phosphate synthase [Mycobacterium vicinigordonae]QLL07399.1 3,4-dihydroxy-2-butanone-4-phosphate synthase [Mycobacterium vicinigordonae]